MFPAPQGISPAPRAPDCMTQSSRQCVPRMRGFRAFAGVVLALGALLALSGCGWVLPFSPRSTATLRSSPKLVFAHYHPQYVISQDNKPASQDMYATQY